MSRPVEQALHNLIPRLSGPLPDELLELAGGLLAQSRSKASNLRVEEEVGRVYACANLACERLKTSLNLPPIEPRPPVAPRIYKKLYSYLEQNLSAGTLRKRQKTILNSTTGSNGIQKSLPQRQTPTKSRALESWKPRAGTKKLTVNDRDDEQRIIPDWMLYVTRSLCKQMQTRKAIPHILAGLWTVLYLDPPQQPPSQKSVQGKILAKEKIPALIAALWWFVSCRMVGSDLDAEEYLARRSMVLNILQAMDEDDVLKDKLNSNMMAGRDWELVDEEDVRAWTTELSERGLIDLDWFLNIQQGDLDVENELPEDGHEELWHDRRRNNEARTNSESMIQRYDFLSEERKKAYKQWEKAILLKLDELTRDGISEMCEAEVA